MESSRPLPDPRESPVYLQRGTPRQQTAYRTIRALAIFERLGAFDPALVSTVCVGFDTEASDLDLVCSFEHVERFEETVRSAYGEQPAFRFRRWQDADPSTAVASFQTESFPIEVFGQARRVEEQLAFRHFRIMQRLAELDDGRLQAAVRKRKRAGMSTEPALAECLGITGADPYQALLRLEEWSSEELRPCYKQAFGA